MTSLRMMPAIATLMAGQMPAILAATAPAAAQYWPTRPVAMVVPFAAGGATDVMARVLAPRLSDHLGQQLIIENADGAGGMTGVARPQYRIRHARQ